MKQRLHLFFLDGERRYSETLSASETWWPKLRDPELLVGDDYGHPNDHGSNRRRTSWLDATG